MKHSVKISFPVLVLLVTSCVISIVNRSYNKVCQKEIDGRKYAFVAGITKKKKNILGFRSIDLESNITFYSLQEEPFRGKLTLRDFEKKAGTKLPSDFVVDSVSFTMEPGSDDVKLIYYLSNMVLPLKITFDLRHNGDEWILDK